MTGIFMATMGAGGGPVAFSVNLNSDPPSGNGIAGMTFNSDGTITVSGTASTTSGFWFFPALPGAGNAFWVKLTLNSGSATSTGPAAGTVNALSSAIAWTWTQTVIGTKVANVTIGIYADAAGTQLVTSAVVPVSVTRET